MKRYVLDTSVAAAWYLPEACSSSAHAWQARALDGDIELLVPGLHYLEFGNVLRTRVRRREIAADLAREIYDLHLGAPLQVHEPDRATLLDTALRFDATVYDAVYIGLALAQDVPLLTAERTTTPWVVKLGRRAIVVR